MANDFANVLIFKGDPVRIRQVLKAIAYENNEKVPEGVNSIDFNKIRPEPDGLYQGEVGTRERKLYGDMNWLDWRIKNWGTKWNSYGYSEKNTQEFEIRFMTANDEPKLLLMALSRKYPDIVIEHQWADEDFGFHCGFRTLNAGVRLYESNPKNLKEAKDFACALFGTTPHDEGYLCNATETDYIHEEYRELDVVAVFGSPGLYSPHKLNLCDIPFGHYLYHLTESEDKTEYTSIDRVAGNNFGGSIITIEPLDFGESDSIRLTEPGSIQFIGGKLNFGEFVRGEFDSAFDESEGMTL